ncbi:RiPP maturation radical SAM C-methyltransferase [Nonomuraea ferruginea]
MLDIALVNMPFADRRRPSFALSQLSSLVQRDFGDEARVRVCYLNHDVVRFFGAELYDAVAEGMEHHVAGIGDWLFRQVAFPDAPDNGEEYFSRYFVGPAHAALRARLMRHRERLGEFCAHLAEKYRLAEADVVGFSSMFMQTVPSLAMAAVVKERSPGTVTVMGGANCEAPMGAALVEHAGQLDYAFSGPALRSFPRFLRAVIDGDEETPHRIPGVVSRRNCQEDRYRRAIGADTDIDDCLEPDYASFVSSFGELTAAVEDKVEPILFFETSRGCWWGERSHCTFCGLNGQGMAYRAMTPDRAVAQFERLFEYAPWCTVYSCTDNIMPLEYLTEVLPRLRPPSGASIFYEVKVGLDQQDMSEMARAGVDRIQPGIEALSTGTLKLMKKGSSAFQNIQLLKNCVRYGIAPAWNLLIGFPGEPESTFAKYLGDLPSLAHLPPPEGVFPVRFDRYSPYFNQARRLRARPTPGGPLPAHLPLPRGVAELAGLLLQRPGRRTVHDRCGQVDPAAHRGRGRLVTRLGGRRPARPAAGGGGRVVVRARLPPGDGVPVRAGRGGGAHAARPRTPHPRGPPDPRAGRAPRRAARARSDLHRGGAGDEPRAGRDRDRSDAPAEALTGQLPPPAARADDRLDGIFVPVTRPGPPGLRAR